MWKGGLGTNTEWGKDSPTAGVVVLGLCGGGTVVQRIILGQEWEYGWCQCVHRYP